MKDYKKVVASAVSQAVDGQLSIDEITAKIETPKSLNLGDYAFPAFVLAKVLRKAPQMIAQDLVEKIDHAGFEKIEAVGPYVNFFLDKKDFSEDVLGDVLSKGASFGDASSAIRLRSCSKRPDTSRSKSIIWATGAPSLAN